MPDKKGRFTGAEKAFAEAYAATGNRDFSQFKAGWRSKQSVTNALTNPLVLSEIRRIQVKRLADEGLPLAVDTIVNVMKDPTSPKMAALKAAELTFKVTAPGVEGPEQKDLNSMTADELQMALDIAGRRMAQLKGNVTDAEFVQVVDDEADVFS